MRWEDVIRGEERSEEVLSFHYALLRYEVTWVAVLLGGPLEFLRGERS